MHLLLLLAMLFSQRTFAQDFFNFLSPQAPSTSIELEGFYLPTTEVDRGSDRSQVFSHSIGLNQKIYKDEKSLIALGVKYQKLDLTSASPLLRTYYSEQVSLSYKRDLHDGKFWLASASYGTASDRPFENSRDNTLSANYIQKMNEKWFFIGNYSNNRPFLNNIPLPGFIYVKEMTPMRTLIVGFPIILWENPLNADVSFRYFGLLPWAHRARLLYTRWRVIMPYLGYDQSPQSYFRHDREDRYDRLFYFERRLQIGIEGRIHKKFRFDLGGGLAFDRQVFEARNFSQEKENEVDLSKTGFVTLSLRCNFN